MSLVEEAKDLYKYSREFARNNRKIHDLSKEAEHLEDKKKFVKAGRAKQEIYNLVTENKALMHHIRTHSKKFTILVNKEQH